MRAVTGDFLGQEQIALFAVLDDGVLKIAAGLRHIRFPPWKSREDPVGKPLQEEEVEYSVQPRARRQLLHARMGKHVLVSVQDERGHAERTARLVDELRQIGNVNAGGERADIFAVPVERGLKVDIGRSVNGNRGAPGRLLRRSRLGQGKVVLRGGRNRCHRTVHILKRHHRHTVLVPDDHAGNLRRGTERAEQRVAKLLLVRQVDLAGLNQVDEIVRQFLGGFQIIAQTGLEVRHGQRPRLAQKFNGILQVSGGGDEQHGADGHENERADGGREQDCQADAAGTSE